MQTSNNINCSMVWAPPRTKNVWNFLTPFRRGKILEAWENVIMSNHYTLYQYMFNKLSHFIILPFLAKNHENGVWIAWLRREVLKEARISTPHLIWSGLVHIALFVISFFPKFSAIMRSPIYTLPRKVPVEIFRCNYPPRRGQKKMPVTTPVLGAQKRQKTSIDRFFFVTF